MSYNAPQPRQEITHRDPGFTQDAALMRVTQDDRVSIREKASTVAKSGLYKDVNTPEKALAIILMGRALGVNELTALQGIYIINGRPWVSADLFLALVRAKKVCKQIEVETSLKGAVCKMVRKDDGFTFTSRFGPEEAQRANLQNNDTYKKYPDMMYMHRAVRRCCQVVCPEILMGLGFDEDGYQVAVTSDEIPGLIEEVRPTVDAEAEVITDIDPGNDGANQEAIYLSDAQLNQARDLYTQLKDMGGNGEKFSMWLKDKFDADELAHVKAAAAESLIQALARNVQKLIDAKEKREAKTTGGKFTM